MQKVSAQKCDRRGARRERQERRSLRGEKLARRESVIDGEILLEYSRMSKI
jgi:hypothetical protein